MAKSEQHLKALQLRRKGVSIKMIANALQVSKSSVSLWCQSIELTPNQKEKLHRLQIEAGYRGRMIGAEVNKQRRVENIQKQESAARKFIGKLTQRDRLMLGIALYWGEGVKARGSTLAITNSDPETILFARDWFEMLGVTRGTFSPYIFISEIHRKREGIILTFWSRWLGIPKEQFARVVFLRGRPKKIYENHDSYYGVLALRVRKGMNLKYYILGLIRACKEKADVAQVVRASHS